MSFTAQSAVEMIEMDLATTTDPLIKKINEVGLYTLKECMQTVYEDGPKRDRRLWIGDLYLEALANAYSYKKHDLTKRCLYLLAALSNDEGYCMQPCLRSRILILNMVNIVWICTYL